jgi:hypothetical protein
VIKTSLRIALAVVAALTFSTRSADAASILYFVDDNQGTDQMAAALATSGHTVTTATSTTDFSTQLGLGSFDLAIFFQQNLSGGTYDTAFSALDTFIAGGGAAIAADWTTNDGHAGPFNAQFAGSFNETQVTVSAGSLLTGIVNPVSLTNPGWGVFSTGLAALAGGSCAATFGNGECAIVIGNGGRTIFNGFLADTFADGAEGRQLFLNEIGAVLAADGTPVPEPSTVVLLGVGIAGLAFRGLRRRR